LLRTGQVVDVVALAEDVAVAAAAVVGSLIQVMIRLPPHFRLIYPKNRSTFNKKLSTTKVNKGNNLLNTGNTVNVNHF
jgi:hypothetical protein